jgi:NAD(P)-dependent dehydrogenase (short-subunit alcohol dehydrogenase family)
MSRLAGKVAIVTGTSPNVGGAIAEGLAAAGAAVTCTDIRREVATTCAEAILGAGGRALALTGDVTDENHADDAVAQTLESFGRVDILVNNAVIFDHKGLLDMPVERFRRQVDVIVTGAFLFTRAAARAMIAGDHGGSVVNVLSTAAWQGQPGNIGYSTAKSAMINFTRSVAMELARYDIRVNGFTPTATLPPDPGLADRMAADQLPPGQYAMRFAAQTPMGRLPSAADYVPSVVFLASDESSMMTGSNITVDGGATAKYWPWLPHSS